MDVDVRRISRRALAVCAALALVAIGNPAYAADEQAAEQADLSLTVSADKVTLDESFPDHKATVVNEGPGGTDGSWDLAYDLSGLDDTVVKVGPQFRLGCTLTGDKLVCVDQVALLPGNSFVQPVPFTLERVPGRKGPAGSFTATAVSENDPDPANNVATVAVEVPAQGVDLVAVAEDVFKVAADGTMTDDPVAPGGNSWVVGAVGNLGDTIASGVKVTVALPRHVTFAEAEPGCVYTTDKRSVTCDYADVTLVPVARDTDPDDDVISVVGIVFPITVAANAPGPVVVGGGKLSGNALATQDDPSATTLSQGERPALPQGLQALSPDVVQDADPADNTAEFKVHIGARPATGGGGGGLPVTGARTGLIGGVGAALVLLGTTLFLVARRRRPTQA
jgi:hypothetical protein